MYEKAYKDASSVADQIRSGAYTGVVREERKARGLVERKKSRQPQQEELGGGSGDQDDTLNMVLGYMTALRDSKEEMMAALGPSMGSASGTKEGVDTSATMGYAPVGGEVSQAREAIGQVESGGNYQAKGPVVQKGRYKGQRALGKYQVMEGNVGPWTEEVLGKRMSPEEFLSSEKAQDAVAEYKLSKAKDKYGSWEDAASVWFSGRPMKVAGDASDGYNTVPEYVSKFQRAMRS